MRFHAAADAAVAAKNKRESHAIAQRYVNSAFIAIEQTAMRLEWPLSGERHTLRLNCVADYKCRGKVLHAVGVAP